MNPLRKTIIRLVIYGLVLGWIAGDLFWWNGFLSRRIARADPQHPEAIALAKSQGVVARVFNHQITRAQLERAVAERLWREGKTPEFLTAANSRIFHYAALNDLIDHELLRVKAKAHATELMIDPAALDARYARFLSRFASEAELLAAARSQGISGREALRERLAAEMQQEAYVESKIAGLIQISPEEMRDWWEKHQEALAHPERVRARHIFLPTWQRDADEVKRRMEEALARLQRGEVPWDELVTTLSEDPASKQRGGDLGWMSRDRLPPDFAAAVFGATPGHAVLCQTRIGWHLVEVIERQATRTRSWEEAKPEAYEALRTAKRDKAVREYRDALRRFEAHKIQIFHDRLE